MDIVELDFDAEFFEFLIDHSLLYFYLIFLVISDIGGFLGLFLGCSLISIVEVLVFFAAKIINSLYRRRIQTQETSNQEEASKDIIETIQKAQRDLAARVETLELREPIAVEENLQKLREVVKDLALKIDSMQEQLMKQQIRKSLTEENGSQRNQTHRRSAQRLDPQNSILDIELLEMISKEIE